MDTEPLPSRRERRIAARRTAILEAAARLFAEQGFHRTTTRDIAQAADVSEGTLYNYFENKDELLMGIMSRLAEVQQMSSRLAEALPGDPRQFLQAMLDYRKQVVDQDGDMLQSVLSEILVDPRLRQRYYQEIALPSLELLEGHLQQRIEQGQIRPVEARMAARILVGLTTGLFVLQVLGDPQVGGEWDKLTDTIVSMIFEGVARKE